MERCRLTLTRCTLTISQKQRSIESFQPDFGKLLADYFVKYAYNHSKQSIIGAFQHNHGALLLLHTPHRKIPVLISIICAVERTGHSIENINPGLGFLSFSGCPVITSELIVPILGIGIAAATPLGIKARFTIEQ